MVKIGMLIADRYEVLEKIGTGGMSVVYRAKDHKLNRLVAIKILKQEFSDNASFVSKFRVEAQAAAGLMHSNIVNVYDVGDEKGMYFIVMELVDGITLKKYIEKKSRLSVKEAISIAIQVSMGLEAAHNNHIIHRDIKPQNIMISRDGKVKVTDFGIAKAATSNTITSNVMGSVHYTSPEQARGGYSDERSDIYSLGITIFEMLTGRVPFNGETTVAIAIKHIQTPMPSPREYVPEIPHSVEQIVLKCCEKSPDRRYQNITELIEDLKQSLIHPDDDFVRMIHPDEESATKLASKDEQAEIRRRFYSRPDDYSGEYDNEDGQYPADQAYPDEYSDTYDDNAHYGSEDDAYGYEDGYSEGYDDGYGSTYGDHYSSEYSGDYDYSPYDNSDYPDSDYSDYDGDYDAGGYSSRRRERFRPDLSLRKFRNSRKQAEFDDLDYVDDDYDYHKSSAAKERIITAFSVIAAIVIGLIIIYFAAGRLGLLSDDDESAAASQQESSQMVAVPVVIGQPADEARTALAGLGLIPEVEYAASTEFASGIVMAASVNEGSMVAQGTSVVLTVSTGTNGVEVPDVTWKTTAEAVSILRGKGFSVSKEERSDEEIDKGLICGQMPEPNTSVPGDTTITIYISTGPSTEGKAEVPALTGYSKDEALARLVEAGLELGTETEVESIDSSTVGLVLFQSVPAGSLVAEGTAIDIQVSKGARPMTYSYNEPIQAPSATEDPNFIPGTEVYVVLTAGNGQKLLDTLTSAFPVPTGFSGLNSSYGTLQMSYVSTSQPTIVTDPDTGEQVMNPGVSEDKTITREILFTAESN